MQAVRYTTNVKTTMRPHTATVTTETAPHRPDETMRRAAAPIVRRAAPSPLLLIPIALLALLLRLHGLNWDNGYHLHPDERFITIVITDRILPDWPPDWRAILDPDHSPLNPRSNDPVTEQPRDFAYGSLPLFVTKAVAGAMQAVTGTPWTDYDHIYLVGRVLSALLDVGTLLIVYALARRYGRGYANLAALLFAVCVLQIQLAHFFATDTWVTFFATAAILAFVRGAEHRRTRDFILGGALTGAAVASKASVAFLVFPALAAIGCVWMWSQRRQRSEDDGDASPTLRAFFLALTTCWSALITFAIAEPYALFRLNTYLAAIGTQAKLVRGDLDYPYTRQYVGTGSLYHFRNLVLWGMGPALGVLVLLGLGWAIVRAVRRRRAIDIVLVAWIVPYLAYTAPQSVKFMRYLQPIYPALIVVGVALIRDLVVSGRMPAIARAQWLKRTLPVLGRSVAFVVVLCTTLWALAFSSIYDQTHARVAASDWIAQNVPPGSVIATEVWDDPLPLSVPGVPAYGCVRLSASNSQCTGLDLYPDEGNGELRLQYLARALGQADYLVMSSNRLYGSIPKLPWRYPVTIRFYDLLFAGQLGFTKVYDGTVSPHLGPWQINDQHADESFTVYDHPRVLIYQKTQALTIEQLRPLFADALTVQAIPRRDPPGKSLLLDRPVEDLPVVSDRAWGGSVAHHGVVAVALYAILFELFGVIGWSVVALAFSRFPDRGWGLAKLIGWLVAAYLVWFGASTHVLSFRVFWCVGTITVLAMLAGMLYWWRRSMFAEMIRASWRVMLATEIVTWLGFALFLTFRLKNPDLWQTYWGGEKPFELAHLNAILRSAQFPPYDPWFAGGYINYYYFGSYLHAFAMKVTGIPTEVAFNVAVPMTLALVWGAAFSVGAALWSLVQRRKMRSPRGLIAGGVAATVAVALLGNMDAFGQVMGSLREGSDLRGAGDRFDFWESTRIIPGTINEFPFFSGLWADLHAHVVAVPFAILAIAVALAVATTIPPRWHDQRGQRPARSVPWVTLTLGALTIGALYCINAWDFPTALVLLALGVLTMFRAWAVPWWRAIGLSVVSALAISIASYAAYYPFFSHFQSLYGSLARVNAPSPLGNFLVIFGFQSLVIALGIVLLRPAVGWFGVMRRNAVLMAVSAIGGLGLVLGLVTRRTVLVVTLPLLVFLVILWLRADQQPGRRMLYGITAVGFGLLSLIEIVFLADDLIGGDFERMNTVFKFDFQVWTLLAFAMVGFAAIVWERWGATHPAWRSLAMTVVVVGMLASLFYPLFGTPARLKQRMSPVPQNAGLDGFAWMRTGSVPANQFSNSSSGEPIPFADDLALIDWMNANLRGTPVIAEASIGPYRGNGSRISSATGFPTIIGWERHEEQQRNRDILPARVDDVRRIYTASEPRAVQAVVDDYHVRYIVVGDVERTTKLGAGQIGAKQTGEPYASPTGLSTLARMADTGMLRIAWQSHDTILYEVTGGWRTAGGAG